MRSILLCLAITLALFSSSISAALAAASAETSVSVPAQGSFAKAISGVYGQYMSFLSEATSKIFGTLQGSFQSFAFCLVTIYIIIVGINLYRGNFGPATKEFALSCFLISGISSLVFNPGQYQAWVFDPFVGTVTDLSNFFVSKGAGVPINSQGDIFSYMGATMDTIYSISDKLTRNVSMLDPTSWGLGLEIWSAKVVLIGGYVINIVIYLYIILQAWFAIFIFMIIGGIFIFLAVFKGTRHLSVAWLRALCHEGLSIVFASLIMGISGNILQELIKVLAAQDVGSTGIFTPQFFAVILACAMGALILLKVPQLAAAISGGSAGSTAGVAALVGGVVGLGYTGLKAGAGRIAGRVPGPLGRMGASLSGAGGGVFGSAGDSGGQGARTPAMGAYTARKGTSTGLGNN